MRLKDMPIRQKLMAVLLLTNGIVLFLACAAFVSYEVISLHKGMLDKYGTQAEIVAENSRAALAFRDESDAARVLDALHADPRVAAACLYDGNGKVFAEYPAGISADLFPPAGGLSGYRNGRLEIFCPVTQGTRKLGTVYLQSDLSALTDRYRAYAWFSAAVIAGSVLAAFLLSGMLRRQIAGPILALAETARAISTHRDFSVRAQKFGEDEVGLLTDAFNRMLAEILAREQALKASEVNYREIFDKANEGILVQELGTGKILDLNQKAVEMLGFSREELTSMDRPVHLASGHPGHTLLDAEQWIRKAEKEGSQLFEWRGSRKNGDHLWLEVSLAQARIAGKDRILAFFRDIGDRKKAEAALGEQTRLLDSIMRNMSEGIAVAGLDGKMLYFNAGLERMTGMAKSANDPAEWSKEYGIYLEDTKTVFPPEESPMITAIRGEEVDGVIQFLRNPDHPEGIFVNVNGRPLRDEAGNLVGGLVVVRDVTEQRRAEALLKSRNIFQTSVEAIRDYSILVLDLDGKIMSWNAGTEAIKGYNASEAIGKNIEMFYTEEDKARGHMAELLRKAASTGRIEEEGWRLRKDGSRFMADVVLAAVKDEAGVPIGFVKVTRDITERRKMEEEIRQSNNFLNMILENIPNMIFVKDAQDLRFVRFNKAGEALLGVPQADLIGKSDYNFFSREDADRFTAKDRKTLDGGRLLDIPEETIQTKDKGTRILHTKKIPVLGADGKPQYLIGISEDITEAKKQEQLRVYTRALEVSNKEMQDFIFVVSHDLQEPLRKIRSFGNFLREEVGPALTPTSDDYLNRMQDAARRMGILIEDLLQLTRVTSRAKPFETVELDQIIREVVSDLEIRMKETNGRVEAVGLPQLEADPAQMRQLFQNLIGNALKFRKKDNDPVIDVTAQVDEKNGQCRIRVKDNGIGFDQKYADKIFNIFQRLNGAEFEGTGIGLAICRKVTERHGGTIRAIAEAGQGAVFEIQLPLHQTRTGDQS